MTQRFALNSFSVARFNADSVTIAVSRDAASSVPPEYRIGAGEEIEALNVLPGSGGGQLEFRLSEMSPDDMRALLAVLHEREHYRTYVSTTFGLFLWRLFQCMYVNVNFLCRLTNKYDLTSAFHAPVTEFVRAAFDSIVGDEAIRPMILDGQIVPRRIRDGAAALECAEETDTYIQCLSLLLDGGDIAVGEFVDVLNKAVAFAALRSGIPEHPVIATRLDPRARLYQDGIFTTRELMEGAARLTEFADVLRYPHWDPGEWRTQYCGGVYGTVLNEVGTSIGRIDIGRALIDLAFMGPIDPCCGVKTVLLEEIHPGLRFRRLIDAASQTVFGADTIGADLVNLEQRLGFTPSDVVARETLTRPLVVLGRWGGSLRTTEISPEVADRHLMTTRFYELMEQKFRANLALRAERSVIDLVAPNALERPKPEPLIAELPNFELFEDYCKQNVYSTNENDDWLRYFHCLRAACLNSVSLAVATGVPASGLSNLVDLALRRIATAGKTAEEKQSSLSDLRTSFKIDDLLRIFFGPAIAGYIQTHLL